MKIKTLIVCCVTAIIFASTTHAGESKEANNINDLSSLPNPLAGNPNIFVSLSSKVIPSVVNITTRISTPPNSRDNSGDMFRKHFEDFFSPGNSPQGQIFPFEVIPDRTALGTGVIIKVENSKAVILTNNHVIENASEIKIQFNEGIEDGTTVSGKKIGSDPDLDLAIIEIDIEKNWNLKPLPFGDSEKLKVGEYVMAVGNPFGQGHSVSHGIISGKGRNAPIIGKYLQTDTPINPGNSGGPLVNLMGEIVGINNAILAQAQGIGFAIPSNSIKPVLEELISNGKVERGFIGILMGEISPQTALFSGNKVKAGHPFIAEIVQQSPAEKAGLRKHDIILSFAGKEVKSPEDLKMAVIMQPVNKTVDITVIRENRIKTLKIKILKREA